MSFIMSLTTSSLRPFLGAKNFDQSRSFYRELGFEETIIEPSLSLFENGNSIFYLQDYYVADWIGNSMLLLEVSNIAQQYHALQASNLFTRFADAKLLPLATEDWADVFRIIDPSGVLWHVGEFKS